MSYWNALTVSGSCVCSASRPPCGIENGLCEKSTFLSSSLYSYIGKSTIQASSNRSLSIRFNSSPSLVRASPANFPDLVLRVFQHPREYLEARASEVFGDVLHDNRIAQIGLVAAVFAQGFREWNPRP